MIHTKDGMFGPRHAAVNAVCSIYERFNADCLAQSMVLNIFTPCLTSLSFFTNKHVNISATRSRFAQVYPVAEDWSSFPSKPQSSALAITVVMCQFNSRCVPRRRRADVPLRHAISPPPHLAQKILTPDFSSPPSHRPLLQSLFSSAAPATHRF